MNEVPNFTPNEAKALHLIAQYRNETVEIFCLETILRRMVKEYDDIKDAASIPVDNDARQRAINYQYQLYVLIGNVIEKARKGGAK